MNGKKKSASQYIYMENLHFIRNNILTKIFNELTKYKNNYQ